MKKNALNARDVWFCCPHEALSSGGARSVVSDFHTEGNKKAVVVHKPTAGLLHNGSAVGLFTEKSTSYIH